MKGLAGGLGPGPPGSPQIKHWRNVLCEIWASNRNAQYLGRPGCLLWLQLLNDVVPRIRYDTIEEFNVKDEAITEIM